MTIQQLTKVPKKKTLRNRTTVTDCKLRQCFTKQTVQKLLFLSLFFLTSFKILQVFLNKQLGIHVMGDFWTVSFSQFSPVLVLHVLRPTCTRTILSMCTLTQNCKKRTSMSAAPSVLNSSNGDARCTHQKRAVTMFNM